MDSSARGVSGERTRPRVLAMASRHRELLFLGDSSRCTAESSFWRGAKTRACAGGTEGKGAVLIGKGTAPFELHQLLTPPGMAPFSVAVTDADGDNHPDLVVANSTAGQFRSF